MAELDAANEPSLGKRRSTRIVQAVPITVAGADALGQPFKERTSTVMVSCHGCKYHSKHYVPKHSVVELEIPRTEASLPPRTVKGQVIWVQRPRTVRELFQIGIEFDAAGNVWGIAFPPDDWAAAIAASEESAAAAKSVAETVPAPAQATPSVVLTTSVLGIPKFTPPATQQNTPPEKKLEIVPPPAAAPAAQVKQPEKSAEPAVVQAKSDSQPTGGSVAVQEPPGAAAPAATSPAAPSAAPVAMAPAPPSPTPNIAKEMEKLVAEARHSLHQVARHESRTAIAEELNATRAKVDLQLREAVEQAVQSSMTRVSAQALDVVMNQAASRAASVVEDARKATRQNVEEIEAQLRQSLQAAVESAASRAAEQAVREANQNANSQAMQQAVQQEITNALANRPQIEAAYFATDDAARARSEELRRDVEQAAARLREESIAQIQNEAAEAKNRWQQELQSTLSGVSEKLNEQINGVTQNLLTQAEHDIAARTAGLRSSLEEASAQARSHLEAVQAGLSEGHARSEEARNQIHGAAHEALENTRRGLHDAVAEGQARSEEARNQIHGAAHEALENARRGLHDAVAEGQARSEEARNQIHGAAHEALENARRGLQDVLAEGQARTEETKNLIQGAANHTLEEVRRGLQEFMAQQEAELQRRAESIVAERARNLEPAMEASARQILERVSGQIEQQLVPGVEAARKAGEELAAARAQAEAAQQSVQSTISMAAEAQLQSSLERLKEQTSQFPVQFEESIRAMLKKAEEDLESKTTESTHTTFESLLKASDWYSKKAQTSMQASLEKAVEHSTSLLHERAAEASRKMASELDHYSRSYADHAKNQMAESANELLERNRERLKEAAETTAATFADETHRVASNTLSEFDQAAQESAERARGELQAIQNNSLGEFREELIKNVAQGVSQARVSLETQLKPLMEQWNAQREQQERNWLSHLNRASDDAIEQYKTRLENASNSWLLASATTLGQHSQAVIEALATAAEKRLRETFSDVLANMGDNLRQRLMGLSTDFGQNDSSKNDDENK